MAGFSLGGLLAGLFGDFLSSWLPGALKLNPASAAKTEKVLNLPAGGAQAVVNGFGEAALTGVVAVIQHLSVHQAVPAVDTTSRSVTPPPDATPPNASALFDETMNSGEGSAIPAPGFPVQ